MAKQETILETDDVATCDLLIKQLEEKFKKGANFLLARKKGGYLVLFEAGKGGPHVQDVIMYADGYLDGLEADIGDDDHGGDDHGGDDDEVEILDRDGKKLGGFDRNGTRRR